MERYVLSVLVVMQILFADAPVLKTGQNVCYDSIHSEVPCTAEHGQDGYYMRGEARRYSRSGDEVTDEATGLTWRDVDAGFMDWTNAKQYCQTTVGNGYRLPRVKELHTLVDYSKSYPALPRDQLGNDIFNNIRYDGDGGGSVGGQYYWSIDDTYFDSSYSYSIAFEEGVRHYTHKANFLHVLCVKGDGLDASSLIRNNQRGTVYDAGTDLTWQDSGAVIDPDNKKSWFEAIEYCASLKHAGVGYWRVPNINEWLMLQDFSTPKHGLPNIFKYKDEEDSPGEWSSSTQEYATYRAWFFVNLRGLATDSKVDLNGKKYVRCVHDGKIGEASKFPGPRVYDSGWVAMASSAQKTLTHNLGTRAFDALVQVLIKGTNPVTSQDWITNYGFGGGEKPYRWHSLTETSIDISTSAAFDQTHVRVQMWQPSEPDFDSGWVPNLSSCISHNIGGDPANYVVDYQFAGTGFTPPFGRNQYHYGGMDDNGSEVGAYWHDLTSDGICIHVANPASDARLYWGRGRIWNVGSADYDSGWNNHEQGAFYWLDFVPVVETRHPQPNNVYDTFYYMEHNNSLYGVNQRNYGGGDLAGHSSALSFYTGRYATAWLYGSTIDDDIRMRYFDTFRPVLSPMFLMNILE